jgi:hypothetical protein
MRKNQILSSLTLALALGAIACGGSDEGVTDSLESLKRGPYGDGGAVLSGRGDREDEDEDEDTDEAVDEASADGGRRGRGRDFDKERGDGGFCGIRGARGQRGQRGGDANDGLTGPRLDGGSVRGDRGDRGDWADRGGKHDGKGDADAGALAP